MKILELDTPSLLIDNKRLNANLQYMQDYAVRHGVRLRPHTKTHKTPDIARMQIETGACGIAVAKTSEASVMVDSGISDVFIANEIVGRTKLERIRELNKRAKVSFGADSPCQILMAEDVFAQTNQIAQILIEIEVGEVRSGIIEKEDFLKLLHTFKSCSHVHFAGLFSHDGNSYHAEDVNACREIAVNAQKRTLDFARVAAEFGMPCEIISYGSTPTFMNDVPIVNGITELRPGTYALMDASQGHAIDTLERCAATVLSTVISKPTSSRIILDVGAKALTMQERHDGICATPGKGTLLDYPEVNISRMFDEHAIIEDAEFSRKVNIGDKVRIIPVHICPVCNLYDEMYLVSGDEVIRTMKILARGKLQ
jgi:D-serine deaminase-like pyridoxal phosphate-dependent protein